MEDTPLITELLVSFIEEKQLSSAIRNNDVFLLPSGFPPGLSLQTSTFRERDFTSAVGEDGKACIQ